MEAESDSMRNAFLSNPILVYLDHVLSKNEGCIRVYPDHAIDCLSIALGMLKISFASTRHHFLPY